MPDPHYILDPIGHVESTITDLANAPKQGDEGAPDAQIVIEQEYRDALHGLEPGAEIFVFTWLDRADRNTLAVHPRDDPANPMRGVFATRSQDRPNPIGLHRVTILVVYDTRITVRGIEALDGTPVVDIKPTLGDKDRR